MRRGLITLALALFCCASYSQCHPRPVSGIEFTVLSGSVHTIALPASGPATSDAADAAGLKYFGLFSVGSDILATDGIANPGDVDFFFIQMEDNIWGYNYPGDNSFRGIPWRAVTPAFDVVNGAITNLHGGVFGYQDSPFVDFSLFGSNTFNARGNVPAQPLQPRDNFQLPRSRRDHEGV